MSNFKNIAFDLGGVVLAMSYENAVKCFEEIGSISTEEFRKELSALIGREVSADDCYYAWHGYVENVPQRNLEALLELRSAGYKVCLLSNTNPYMMQWARSTEFDGSPANCAAAEALGISTLCPHNNEDWTEKLKAVL